ncbi:glycosyltransferase [Lachnospiraceae bacterium C1.1]|nr:glycosyltransferase [Lachnospiraceae bacterium C1.1]
MKKCEYETALERVEYPYRRWIKENEKSEYDCNKAESDRKKVLEDHYLFTSKGASIEERLYAYVLNYPDMDFIYADEDLLDEEGNRTEPYFKSDWAPETILSYYYPGSITVVKKKIADLVEKEFPYKKGSNDFLRECALKSATHLHINEVLLHRTDRLSTEYEKVPDNDNSEIRISCIILSKDHPEMLEKCVTGLNKAAADDNIVLRTIVVDNGSSSESAKYYEAASKLLNFEYCPHPMPFEYSTLCNFGASLVKDNELLLFLNDDIEVPAGTLFLRKMAEMALRKEVGAVGCKLLYPDGIKIQHNGISLLKSGPSHRLCTYTDDREYCGGVNTHSRNVIAVTGAALMCSYKKFRAVGGFDEGLKIAYTDVDLCFAFIREGLRNVCMSDFYLIHHESISRDDDIAERSAYERLKKERKFFENKYADILAKGDIYESSHWSRVSLNYEPLLESFEEKLGVTDRLDILDKRKYRLKQAGKRFHYSLDTISYRLNDAFGNENFYEIQGWAFMGGCPGYEYDLKIVIENGGRRYILDSARRYRSDIEMVFAEEKNCRLSGFIAKIRADIIPEGDNKIYLALVRRSFFSKDILKGEIADSGKVISL